MAALPYMQFYAADYLADTMHLTTEEHGAYLLLIFNYWQTGKPIPVSRLARITRLSNDRWTDVEQTLSEFFTERSGEWVHERIERDLEALRAAQEQRVAAGKASAESRKRAAKTGKTRASNARSTPVEDSLNENQTNKEQNRTEHKEQKHNVDAERQPDASTDSENSDSRVPPCPAQAIVDLFHKALPELPRVSQLNDLRRRHLQARWRENPVHQDLGFWADYFTHVKGSRFLLGNAEGRNGGKPFRATFDWLIAPSNFVKVIEGNYHA